MNKYSLYLRFFNESRRLFMYVQCVECVLHFVSPAYTTIETKISRKPYNFSILLIWNAYVRLQLEYKIFSCFGKFSMQVRFVISVFYFNNLRKKKKNLDILFIYQVCLCWNAEYLIYACVTTALKYFMMIVYRRALHTTCLPIHYL